MQVKGTCTVRVDAPYKVRAFKLAQWYELENLLR